MTDSADLAQRLERLQQAVRLRLSQARRSGMPPLVLLSVSGGADSTFLLHLLHAVAHSFPVYLHVMHIDHGQRATSHLDAQFVEAMCHDLELPFHGYALGADELRTADIHNRQAALRRMRYHRLSAQARSLAADGQIPIVATGHHAHDLAETLLMNLVRGTSLHGLRGIQEWQLWAPAGPRGPLAAEQEIYLYRPLLGWDRPAIESLLTHWGIAWREDPTNRDTRYVRNRIRHEVMPVLEALNPRFVLNLVRRSQDWTAVVDSIQQLHEANLQRLTTGFPPAAGLPSAVVWDRDQFRSLPAWQQTGFLYTVSKRLNPTLVEISTARLENLACALEEIDHSGGPWPWFQNLAWSSWHHPAPRLFGLAPSRILISLHWTGAMPFVLDHPSLSAAASEPATIRLRDTAGCSVLPVQHRVGDWILALREITDAFSPDDLPTHAQPWRAILDLDHLEAAGAFLRLAPPDKQAYMQPLGMTAGRKRLDRLLRDRKIHPSLHAVWPVLYDIHDRVVWICGLHLDQRFALHAETRRLVEIQWCK